MFSKILIAIKQTICGEKGHRYVNCDSPRILSYDEKSDKACVWLWCEKCGHSKVEIVPYAKYTDFYIGIGGKPHIPVEPIVIWSGTLYECE